MEKLIEKYPAIGFVLTSSGLSTLLLAVFKVVAGIAGGLGGIIALMAAHLLFKTRKLDLQRAEYETEIKRLELGRLKSSFSRPEPEI
jgi:hypothetical protein